MCANLAVSRRRASSCSLWSQIRAIPGGLTVAERRFGRYPAFMSAEMAVRRRRRDALLAPQEGSEYEEPLLRD